MKRILLNVSSVQIGASIAWCGYPYSPCPPGGTTCGCGQGTWISTTDWCCQNINGCTPWFVAKWTCTPCNGLPGTQASYVSSTNNPNSPGCNLGTPGACL